MGYILCEILSIIHLFTEITPVITPVPSPEVIIVKNETFITNNYNSIFMARTEEIAIERHMTVENLNRYIKSLETDVKILKRLYFVKYRYEGLSVQESAERVGTSKQIGYGWQSRWNSEGYEGLIPKYAGGRPSKLSDKQKEMLKITLDKRDDWTTEEVREQIYDDFNVTYTAKRIREILKGFGMKHGKPYCHDYRRPKDSEETLKKLTRH